MTDLFDNFKAPDEFMALVLHELGPEGLQELLATLADTLDRETLTEAADKLEAAGLSEGVAIVRQAAEHTQGNAEREIAKIFADPIVANQRAYLAHLYRRGQINIADMEEAGVDANTMAFAAGSIQ